MYFCVYSQKVLIICIMLNIMPIFTIYVVSSLYDGSIILIPHHTSMMLLKMEVAPNHPSQTRPTMVIWGYPFDTPFLGPPPKYIYINIYKYICTYFIYNTYTNVIYICINAHVEYICTYIHMLYIYCIYIYTC